MQTALERLDSVESAELTDQVGNRKCYLIHLSGADDPRPAIFNLAKENNWTLWELHEQRTRLEDVFHDLTSTDQTSGTVGKV